MVKSYQFFYQFSIYHTNIHWLKLGLNPWLQFEDAHNLCSLNIQQQTLNSNQ